MRPLVKQCERVAFTNKTFFYCYLIVSFIQTNIFEPREDSSILENSFFSWESFYREITNWERDKIPNIEMWMFEKILFSNIEIWVFGIFRFQLDIFLKCVHINVICLYWNLNYKLISSNVRQSVGI